MGDASLGTTRARTLLRITIIYGPSGKPAITKAARRAVDLRFVELMDKVRRNRPGDDLELLRRAYDFAAEQTTKGRFVFLASLTFHTRSR